MNRCIYTKDVFESADGEHILQNFLGARWTSDSISSNQAQHKFGETIDVALADGLKEIRALIGGRGGRGETGPSLKNIAGSEGTRFTIGPGGKPSIAEPVVKATPLDGGQHQVEIAMGNIKQLGWAIRKLQDQFPEAKFDVNELRKLVASQSGYMNERVHLTSSIGGADFFRGLLKATFNLLGASDAKIALEGIFDEVRVFILEKVGDFKKFVRWLNTGEEIHVPKIGAFDQFVSVFSNGTFVDGYIQFYGEIGFSVRLAEGYAGRDFCYSYLVDSLREQAPAEIRNPDFNKKNIPSFEEGSELPNDLVFSSYRQRYSRILERYYERGNSENISRIIDEILSPYEGELMTDELINELSRKIAEYAAHHLVRNSPE